MEEPNDKMIKISLEEYRTFLNGVVEEVSSDMPPDSWSRMQLKMRNCVVVDEKDVAFKGKKAIYKEIMKQTMQKRNPFLFTPDDTPEVVERPPRKHRSNVRLKDL